MKNIKNKLIVVATIITVCGFATSKAYAVENKVRLAGNNRYETAIAVSQDGWKTSDTVILANGEEFPDALCASPLARKYKAPILLTPSAALDPKIENEIQRLGAKKIIIVGGTGVVSQAIENKLKSKGIEVSRYAGKDRFETSLSIAKEVKGTGSEIAVVSSDSFADALSVAPIAANRQMPIILMPHNNIPANVNQYIKENNINKTYVIGGSGILPDSLVSGLPGFERVSGLNRYATNTAVLDRFASDINFETTYAAYGEDFPDALACSALAPITSSPIILVSNNVPNNILNLVKAKFNYINNFKVIGGTGVMPDSLVRPMIDGVMIGDTPEEVVNVMGKPSSSEAVDSELDYWYNVSSCMIYFYNNGDGYKVIGWSNYDHFLKVTMGSINPSAPPFTIGSSRDDVVKACGTPDWNSPFFGIKNDDFPSWTYQNGDYVLFDKNYKVIGWYNKGGLKVTLGQVDPNAPPVMKGSSLQDILRALGTPISVHNGGPTAQITDITYSDCYFQLDNNGNVIDIINHGNPKVLN